jgi:membrane-bound ClpP family serine protease
MSLRLITFSLALLFFMFLGNIQKAHSLDYLMHIRNQETNEDFLVVSGNIVVDDHKRVIEAYKSIKNVKGIFIDGPGGQLTAGLAIADFVYSNNVPIFITPEARCSSACAFIAYASQKRTMYETSVIGLHRAFTIEVDERGNPKLLKTGKPKFIETDETRMTNAVLMIKFEKWNMPIFSIVKWMLTNPIDKNGDPTGFYINAEMVKKFDLGLTVLPDINLDKFEKIVDFPTTN